MAGDNKTYVSNGEVLGGPPVSVRISRFFESVYIFFGLYFTTLLSNIADPATFSTSLTPTPPPKTRSSTFPAEETDWEVAATDLAGVAQEVPVVLEVLGQEQEGLGG
ncbi:uncharacterized protein ASPGLDRAFT_35519 [Aspergillus glaucus CBS 516.65]|uniref:Uncharacterized protein n=1 Tax=Aspergillus glaucus CBS 516.65 TaxID=1160497 RepID=A0A1L9VJZ6_ASPGL|nr:hypothetical protein ASPGLDRAFT_35519 [Aspergillus glaucus CBS 516.65]OJJ84237.1 hypothetical protein ASPGLDRAFT_35519 [Aspergillus glaucus CBS 516.65]